MTKKDYELLAEALVKVRPPKLFYQQITYTIWKRCVDGVADALAIDNPKFNRSKFEDHCGLTDE